MSDLTINATLRNAGSMASRPVSSGKDGGEVPAASTSKVPSPDEFHTSPKGSIDSNSGLFVIQFRDGDGSVTMQYPSSKAAHEYSKNSSDAPQRTEVDPTNNPSEASETV